VAQVLSAPAHPYTAKLLASTVHGQPGDRDIDAIPRQPTWSAAPAARVQLCAALRPADGRVPPNPARTALSVTRSHGGLSRRIPMVRRSTIRER